MNVQAYKDLFNLIISPKNEYKNQQLSIPNALYNLLLSPPPPHSICYIDWKSKLPLEIIFCSCTGCEESDVSL